MPDRSTRAGARSGSWYRPRPDQPGSLLLGPDGDTAPGVSQIPGRLLVVG